MANEDTGYTDEAIEAIEAIVQGAENALELLPALDDILSGKAPLEGLRERSIAKGASEALVEVRWRLADAEEARSFANSIGLEHLSVVAAMQELNAAALQAATRAQAAEAEIARWKAHAETLLSEVEKLREQGPPIPYRPPGRYRDTDGAIGTIGRPHRIYDSWFQVLFIDANEPSHPENLTHYRTMSMAEAQRLVQISPGTSWGAHKNFSEPKPARTAE